jgi:hypothetical protein
MKNLTLTVFLVLLFFAFENANARVNIINTTSAQTASSSTNLSFSHDADSGPNRLVLVDVSLGRDTEVTGLDRSQGGADATVCTKYLAISSETHYYIDQNLQDKEVLLEALENSQNTLHLFSHGRPGELFINGKWLQKEAIADFLKETFL